VKGIGATNERWSIKVSKRINIEKKINYKPSKHGIWFSEQVIVHIRTLRGCLDEQH
jgi:hypothetical protein